MNKLKGGLSDELTIEDIAKKFDEKIEFIQSQLNKGIEIEKEHTNNDEIAREIAMDHISEYPNYYEELNKLEDKLESENEVNENELTDIYKMDVDSNLMFETKLDLVFNNLELVLNEEKSFENDKISFSDLKKLESYLDEVFGTIGIDITFSSHFSERMNDPRNGEQIRISEIKNIFKEVYKNYRNIIASKKNDFEAVIKSISTKINLPFVLVYNYNNNELDLVAKTVMRKKDFKTTNPVLKVEEMKKIKVSKEDLKEMVIKALNLKEDDNLNPNDESDMADSQMTNIIAIANEIEELVKNGDQLDAWVQSLISVAEFQLKTVKEYLAKEETTTNDSVETGETSDETETVEIN